MTERTVHQDRNVKHFREMLGIKQDALAADLGDDWNQQKVSLLEQKETIDMGILQQISAALKIPVEAIENFDEEQAINIISNTINNHDQSAVIQFNPTFNPVEKWMEALEEARRLNAALLQEKDEKIKLLEKMLDKGK